MTADPTTTDLADRAAQAVRELNHRTRGADAFTGPAPVFCAATTYLADAGDAAHDLADLLNSAQQYLATLGSAPPRHDPKCNPGRRAKDLADLAAGRETGWWDEKGRPAPWPDDFFDPDSDWCIGGIDDDDPPVALAPGEAPF